MSGHSAYPSHGRNDYPRGKASGQAKPLASKKAKVGTTTLPLQQIHCSKTIAEFRQDDCVNAVAQGTVGDDAPADQRDHSAREFRGKKIVEPEHRRWKVSGRVVIVWIGSSTSGTASSSSATKSSAGGDSDHDRPIFFVCCWCEMHDGRLILIPVGSSENEA